MSDEAIEFAGDINELLDELGEPVHFTTETVGGGFDEISGDPIPAPPPLVLEGVGYPARYVAQDVDGTAVLASDVRLVCGRLTSRPEKNMKCTVDVKVYRVMSVQPIRMSGEDVVYICQLRSN